MYRDVDVGFCCDELLNLQNEGDTDYLLEEADCESDTEQIQADMVKCEQELEWAFNEYQQLGSQLMESVLLRNPDI